MMKCEEREVKKRAKWYIAVLGLAALAVLAAYGGFEKKPEERYEYSQDYVQVSELPAMLEFFYYTRQEWEEKLAEEKFGPVVTDEVVRWIFEQTSSTEYLEPDTEEASSGHSFFPFGKKKEKRTLSRAEWNDIYGKILDLLDEDGSVRISDEVILEQDEETLICSSGTYECSLDGLSVRPMTAMQLYIRKDGVIGIGSLKSRSAVLSNVYVKNADESGLEFLTKGRQFRLDLAVEDPATVSGHISDILWEDGAVAKVQVKQDTIQGNLIAVNDSVIEIEGYGEIKRSADLPVFQTYGLVEEKDLSNIVIANMKVEYVVAEDRVEAILLEEPAQISRIRVLLLDDGGGQYREDVRIGANAAYQVDTAGITAGQPAEAVVSASELFAGQEANSIRIAPTDENGLLYLCDENGGHISKGYQGCLELRRYPEGFAVVSELPIEQYLCAVVPSEMPSSYEPEALKAQAVCARSYAYIQMGNGDYAAFGAHVDDTTNYQVYNKQDRDDKTTRAVFDTAGTVIRFQGEIAEAYYFSTSAGVTGNGEAWNLSSDPKYGYLKKGLVREGAGEPDLSSEEAFAKFVAEPDGEPYERACPYFRWNAVGNYKSKKTLKKIKNVILTRRERTPADLLLYDAQGRETESMEGFGSLSNISVTKRGSDGVILQMKLEYENGSVLAGNEYNIRAILGAGVKELSLSDGSKRESALLPSAYAAPWPLEDGTCRIAGGGYGHGIGMSQNGAQAMAASGKSCIEILNFFFQNIELGNGENQ